MCHAHLSYAMPKKSITLTEFQFLDNGTEFLEANASVFAACIIKIRLMLYTRLASPIVVCIDKRGRNTRLAWLANPNPYPTHG